MTSNKARSVHNAATLTWLIQLCQGKVKWLILAHTTYYLKILRGLHAQPAILISKNCPRSLSQWAARSVCSGVMWAVGAFVIVLSISQRAATEIQSKLQCDGCIVTEKFRRLYMYAPYCMSRLSKTYELHLEDNANA